MLETQIDEIETVVTGMRVSRNEGTISGIPYGSDKSMLGCMLGSPSF